MIYFCTKIKKHCVLRRPKEKSAEPARLRGATAETEMFSKLSKAESHISVGKQQLPYSRCLLFDLYLIHFKSKLKWDSNDAETRKPLPSSNGCGMVFKLLN